MIFVRLFLVFARIGIFGFGGGVAMLPMIYQGCRDFGFMTNDDFSDLVAISQMTPGPLAVNAATYVGYQTAGIPGAAVATFGVALPSFLLVIAVCAFLAKFQESRVVTGVFRGVRPVTVGLVASAVIMIGQGTFQAMEPIPLAILAGSFLLAFSRKISTVWVIVICGIAGALLCC